MSAPRLSTGSSTGSLMQDVPGAFPEPLTPTGTTQQSLSQAIHARRAEFTRPKRIRIKVGTWNTASFKGTEKDIGGWFVQGKGVADALTGLQVSDDDSHAEPASGPSDLSERETADSQEARFKRKQETLPKNDPGSVPGGDEIDLYFLGLQEVIDVNSASHALRPYTDPSQGEKWKEEIEGALPPGYQLVAEQQLIGLLLLIYASPGTASDIKSVSTTSVGTGLMGYMGNKGAVTARLVLGETTRVVFVNCHLAAGTDKGSVERRNWDYSQILSRTKFEPIQDSMGIVQNTGEVIDDADVCFWVGDLNYRLEGVPGNDIRRLLMLHTRNEYDLSQHSSDKVESEIAKDRASSERKSRDRSSTASTTSTVSSTISSSSNPGRYTEGSASIIEARMEEALDPASDPASLQTTLASLLPHDELKAQQQARQAFHDGWKEGPITFLPTYKYDIGSVGVFDSSEKRRAPSWCDRILYRTRRDKLAYESLIAEEAESRRKDEEMTKHGIHEAGKDEELLYDYDPDNDAVDDSGDYSDDAEAPPGVLITKEGFEDEIHLEYYTAHQRVLSSDHKPLDAVFHFKYDAVVPELKAKVHAEVARELDKAENEGRPSVTVVVDPHHLGDQETSDEDPARFEGVYFGSQRFAQSKHRSLTIANTGRAPAVVSFVERPVGPGQSPGITPTWLALKIDEQTISHSATNSGQRHLEPGDVCNVELSVRIWDPSLVKDLNEGIKQLDDILVLRVENGRDHFIPIRGKWLESTFGRSIETLIRIPEGGIRKLQHQRPKGSRGKESSETSEELPVKWSAPRELFRLTEAAETLTEACVAEWTMTAGDQKSPWHAVAGWPFVEDSWGATTLDERLDGMADVCNALDTDQPIDSCFEPGTPQQQKVECLAAFFMSFIRSMPDGIITDQIWQEIETYLSKVENERYPPSTEDQRTSLQEIISQSSANSISFILVASMLDRMIQEMLAGSGQSPIVDDSSLPPTPTRWGSMRRRNLPKEPSVAFREIVSRALSMAVGDAMIKSPMPTRDKEKSLLQDRKARLVSLFLTSPLT